MFDHWTVSVCQSICCCSGSSFHSRLSTFSLTQQPIKSTADTVVILCPGAASCEFLYTFKPTFCHISAGDVFFREMRLVNQRRQLCADKRQTSAKSRSERSGIRRLCVVSVWGGVNPKDFQSQTQHLTASNIRIVFLSEEVIRCFVSVGMV